MVKLQPSKLIMRVRFPLPALPTKILTYMKTVHLAMLMLAGIVAVPASYAGSAKDNAVALAAADSRVSLGAICLAVYEAVKAEPQEAVSIYAEVINQRTTWTPNECASIFRAVLMARPDLKGNFSSYVRTYNSGKNSKDEPTAHPEIPQELFDMLNALYQASLAEGVAEATINELIRGVDVITHTPDVLVTPNDASPGR